LAPVKPSLQRTSKLSKNTRTSSCPYESFHVLIGQMGPPSKDFTIRTPIKCYLANLFLKNKRNSSQQNISLRFLGNKLLQTVSPELLFFYVCALTLSTLRNTIKILLYGQLAT